MDTASLHPHAGAYGVNPVVIGFHSYLGSFTRITDNLLDHDLAISSGVPDDIAQALKSEPGAWPNFLAFPELYRRVRVGFIEEQRKDRAEFERRLGNFVKKSAANQMFGNWNDGGRLG